ncbi:lysophospholipid acyltransferase family protein [Thalassospira marina]|uniref:1-acyl-sn-glycerol-3-phosphate acyltransferase n=1 Tax=Thalassospira marina TaxID=2048283 RepID=A0A2N3KW46_9PROT|nr:lysophospholipid acyltransferase family protein [Thalassospira marina]AUG54733.1 1-acyl-sn-glycerol-3-phosphate acyltransferase [Thalassospira marina]PKR54737.1 1-acyl-sn-glycerol-3-phosphate acyltransferase [Thalassospira marina]
MSCYPCAAIRLLIYAVLTLVLLPVQMVALALRLKLADDLPRFYHGLCLKIMHIEVRYSGAPLMEGSGIIVANHASYLDIPVLGAMTKGSFIAKKEVASWPVFGLLAKLQRCTFVERRPVRAREQTLEIKQRLASGHKLILFPEGTSNDGNRVLPFKSTLFGVADTLLPDGSQVMVQPVSIAATRLDGAPMGRDLRAFYSWYGDMDLAPHLWQFLALGKVTVEVVVHPPMTLAQAGSRKEMARICESLVVQGHQAALSGANQGAQIPLPEGRRSGELIGCSPLAIVFEDFRLFG